MACLGAALAAAMQALEGRTPAAAVSAAVAGMLAAIGLLGLPDHGLRFLLGGAAAMVAIVGFARVPPGGDRWLPTAGAAVLASTCDPAYAPLVAVAAIYTVGTRPTLIRRWVIALLLVAGLGTLAVIAAAMFGQRMELWRTWSGLGEAATIEHIADVLGPMAACTGLAGLLVCVVRGRLASVAVAAVAAMTAVIAVSTRTVPPAVPIVAALCSGVGLSRFAATIRSPVGQAFAGATFGFMLVTATAWRLIAFALSHRT